MITNPAVRWALTILFVVCIGLYGRAAISARVWPQRLAWWLHALMAVAMIAMFWPAGMVVSPLLYVLVFTAGALYFGYLGLFRPGVEHPGYHTAMMAGMVAMAIVMDGVMPGAMPTEAMPAGAMPGMSPAVMGAASGAPPGWVSVVSVVAAVGFLAASGWLLVREPRRSSATLLMSLGMGIAFAVTAI